MIHANVRNEVRLWRGALMDMRRREWAGLFTDGVVAAIGILAMPGEVTILSVGAGVFCGSASRFIRSRNRVRSNGLEVWASLMYAELRDCKLNGYRALDALAWARDEWPGGFTRPQIDRLVEKKVKWAPVEPGEAERHAETVLALLLEKGCVRAVDRIPNQDYRITALGRRVVDFAGRETLKTRFEHPPDLE